MKKLIMGLIVVAMLIYATANTMVFAEELYDTFEYYDADNDTYVTEYYFYGHGENDSFEYYDADNDRYCIEYYYYIEEAEETEDWCPDYSDLYQDEFQAAWYSPAKVFDWADFYSLEGEYICSIAPETWVQPLESIGTSGDITYISYDGYTGYIYTTLLLNPYGVTYDEIYQGGGTLVQLLTDANLRDENGNILTTIPAGYGVEFISYDDSIGRCWVRWNGRVGTIITSAIWNDSGCYYGDEEDYTAEGCYEECYHDECGYARITPSVGANVRDCDNNIITAVPCGEEVMLLEPINEGGRTLIKWGCYVGTVLTSCLKVCSA